MAPDIKKARRILNKLRRNGYNRLLEGTSHFDEEKLDADIKFLRDLIVESRGKIPR